MQCPFCRFDNDRVVDSRVIGDGRAIRRRRECLECQKRFTTYERIEVSPRMVVKKDDRREFYSRSKVLAGLVKACKKRNVTKEQLEAIVDKVEIEVFEESGSDIDSHSIGEKVTAHLRALDKVASVRFASVYRDFKDVEDFLHEVEDLAPVSK